MVFKAGMDTAERFRVAKCSIAAHTRGFRYGFSANCANTLAGGRSSASWPAAAPETILHSPIGAACGRVQ